MAGFQDHREGRPEMEYIAAQNTRDGFYTVNGMFSTGRQIRLCRCSGRFTKDEPTKRAIPQKSGI